MAINRQQFLQMTKIAINDIVIRDINQLFDNRIVGFNIHYSVVKQLHSIIDLFEDGRHYFYQ